MQIWGAWKSLNYEILEVILSGSDPDARDKEKRGEKNCRKYATEMKNAPPPAPPQRGREEGKRHFQSAKIGGYKKRSSSNELLPFDKVLTLITQRLS